jgi:hypothetical protein
MSGKFSRSVRGESEKTSTKRNVFYEIPRRRKMLAKRALSDEPRLPIRKRNFTVAHHGEILRKAD